MWVSPWSDLAGPFYQGTLSLGPFFLDNSGSLKYSPPDSSCVKGAGFLGLEYSNEVKLLLSPSVF